MEKLKSIIIMTLCIIISVCLSILVMIYGWGLQPKSFWWIIGVGIFGQILVQIFIEIGKQ
jgi:hypothetical protein